MGGCVGYGFKRLNGQPCMLFDKLLRVDGALQGGVVLTVGIVHVVTYLEHDAVVIAKVAHRLSIGRF